MSNPTHLNSLTNDQTFLINILQTMYNENNRQINNHTTIIDELNFSNTIIRNTIIQTLNSISNPPTNRTNASGTTRPPATNATNATNVNDNNTQPVQHFPQFNIESIRYVTYPLDTEQTETTQDTNYPTGDINPTADYSNFLQNFLQPIAIFPTHSQIETATRRVLYRDIISPLNVSCPILQQNFENDSIVSVIRHCGHIFNTDELNVWFETSCRCPVCRYDVREYISPRNSVAYPTPINNLNDPAPPLGTRTRTQTRRQTRTQTQTPTPNSLITNIVNQITNGSLNDISNNYTMDVSYNIQNDDVLLNLLNDFTQNRNSS
ncbi:hypothetical protein N9K75_00050 [bacterium]|nr:hypothetical protein [bacterium]